MLHIADGNAQERDKYAEIWSLEEYQNAHSPGLEGVDHFMANILPAPGASMLDIGCGQGRSIIEFRKRGLDAWGLDITGASLLPDVPRGKFIEAPIWSDRVTAIASETGGWDYGFCCDVMEHLPTEYTMLAIDRALSSCNTVWFQICNLPDEFGKLIGQPLHLTVQNYKWWLLRMATLGQVIDARDLCGTSLFVVTR